MKVMQESPIFASLFLVAFCTVGAFASLTELLPESFHYEGSTFYDIVTDDGFLRGRIDFAVYDTDNLLLPGETDFADALGLECRYIYAYQVFNDLFASDEAVSYFAVFGTPEESLDIYEQSIGSYDDGAGGIEPSDEYFTPSNTRAVWDFGGSYVYAGDHSWFLVFGSDLDWVAGDYEIRAPEDNDFPVAPNIPEPATVALLGMGLMVLLRQRRTGAK